MCLGRGDRFRAEALTGVKLRKVGVIMMCGGSSKPFCVTRRYVTVRLCISERPCGQLCVGKS